MIGVGSEELVFLKFNFHGHDWKALCRSLREAPREERGCKIAIFWGGSVEYSLEMFRVRGLLQDVIFFSYYCYYCCHYVFDASCQAHRQTPSATILLEIIVRGGWWLGLPPGKPLLINDALELYRHRWSRVTTIHNMGKAMVNQLRFFHLHGRIKHQSIWVVSCCFTNIRCLWR